MREAMQSTKGVHYIVELIENPKANLRTQSSGWSQPEGFDNKGLRCLRRNGEQRKLSRLFERSSNPSPFTRTRAYLNERRQGKYSVVLSPEIAPCPL